MVITTLLCTVAPLSVQLAEMVTGVLTDTTPAVTTPAVLTTAGAGDERATDGLDGRPLLTGKRAGGGRGGLCHPWQGVGRATGGNVGRAG